VQSDHGTKENSPQKKRQSANGQQRQAQRSYWEVVIFGDPYVEPVFGEIRYVVGKCGGVVMHGFTSEDPAHVRPPFSVARGVRITLLVCELMMNAVRSHPENGSAFKTQRAAEGKKILDPLGGR
jgi:hypothetical protein